MPALPAKRMSPIPPKKIDLTNVAGGCNTEVSNHDQASTIDKGSPSRLPLIGDNTIDVHVHSLANNQVTQLFSIAKTPECISEMITGNLNYCSSELDGKGTKIPEFIRDNIVFRDAGTRKSSDPTVHVGPEYFVTSPTKSPVTSSIKIHGSDGKRVKINKCLVPQLLLLNSLLERMFLRKHV